MILHLDPHAQADLAAARGEPRVEMEAELLVEEESEVRRLDRDVGVELRVRDRRRRLGVRARRGAGGVRVGDVLSQDVEDPRVAAPREIRELGQGLLELLAGDVPRREAPHDRAGDVGQGGEDELVEQRRRSPGTGRGF
jgi:hypothetical protein